MTIKWKTKQKCSEVNAIRDTSFLKGPAKVKQYKVTLHEHLRSFISYIVEAAEADKAFNNFNRMIMEITDEFAPPKTSQSKLGKNSKCILTEPKNLRTSKNFSHCKRKKITKNVHLEKLRYKFENPVRINKKRCDSNAFESCMGDSRQVYKLLNDLSGKSMEDNNVHFLRICGVKCPSDSDIANAFNDIFADSGINISSKLPYVPLQTIPSHDKSMFLYPTSDIEVQKTLDELDNKSSSGLDNILVKIRNVLVKISSEVTVPYLTYLINLSFFNGKFPGALAKGKVIPLHKDGDKTDETIIGQHHCLLLGVKFLKELCIFDCIIFSSTTCCLRINNLDSAGNTGRLMPWSNLMKGFELAQIN